MKQRLYSWYRWLDTTKQRKWKVAALVGILLLGIFLRVFLFPTYPAGLNQDEISETYESYSLLTTGADRWGTPWPAYFLGWGSGQNVLQAYLTIPVVAVFGLSPLSVRLVPLLIGILTLPLLFWVVRRVANTTTALVATLILAVCPWHVLLSRWGLESNILPFFLLLGVASVQYALGVSKKQSWKILFALLPFAFGFYAYGTSAIVIPLLVVGMFITAWKRVLERWRWWLGAVAIAGIVSLPFIVFVLKNYVFHHALGIEHMLPFSIPLLEESRLDQIRTAMQTSGDPIVNILFIGNGFNDQTVYNVVQEFLPLPMGILILAIAGIAITIRNAIKTRMGVVSPFLLWLLAVIPLFFIVALNVNQANALFIPLIVLAAIASTRIAGLFGKQLYRTAVFTIITFYTIIMGIWAFAVYSSPANANALATNYHPELQAAFQHLDEASDGKQPVYITEAIWLNYVQTLFYTHTSPAYFQSFHPTPDIPDFANYYFSYDRIPAGHSFLYIMNTDYKPPCTNKPTVLWQQNSWQVGRCSVD